MLLTRHPDPSAPLFYKRIAAAATFCEDFLFLRFTILVLQFWAESASSEFVSDAANDEGREKCGPYKRNKKPTQKVEKWRQIGMQ